ncbi:MAG: phytanoyl-CoA dioxygenase family protein [Burkholderiales bacterium]
MSALPAQIHHPSLSPREVEAFFERGYHFPKRVLSSKEAATYRARLEAFERTQGGPLSGALRNKPHLLFTWIDALVRHPTILDAVEAILGPNLLVWSSSFFSKEANDPAYVSWHQDSTYWGLSAPDVITAWVGFTDSNVSNGCMQVIPGTHLKDQLPHKDTFAENNLLTRGQEVEVDVDPDDAVNLIMQAGEMSLHHVRLVHGSPPNPSNDRRIGYAIRYVPTTVYQTAGKRDSAMLVRGIDTYHHFDPEPRPIVDFGADERAFHAASNEESMRILYRGTDKAPQ